MVIGDSCSGNHHVIKSGLYIIQRRYGLERKRLALKVNFFILSTLIFPGGFFLAVEIVESVSLISMPSDVAATGRLSRKSCVFSSA